MKRVIVGLFLAASFSASGLAAGQSPNAQPASTLQSNSNLVVVDVVVADSHHNPIHKLTKADFTVLEDGKAQVIKSFEEHSSIDAPASLPPLPKLPPGAFTNYADAPPGGALNILLLDALNTPMLDQTRLREEVLKYLDGMRPGTRIAIIGLTDQLLILQGFTSDPRLLRTVLTSRNGAPRASPLLDDPASGNNPAVEDPLMDLLNDVLSEDWESDELTANLKQFEAEMQAYQLQSRQRYTLDAFNQLARYLSALPGRKNLIWFSGSFPIDIQADPALPDPFSDVSSAEYELRETTALLSKSQVAVYPIDARGLTGIPMLAVSNSGSKYVPGNYRPPRGGAHTPGSQIADGMIDPYTKDMNTFVKQTTAEHDTMRSMADATGGEPFLQTNDLKEAVDKAFEDGSNYYTLSYTPANQKWNGAFRKIQVQSAAKDITLSYRRGYFANDPNAQHLATQPVASTRDKSSGSAPAPYNPMVSAMLRGSPEPTQITFVAAVRPNSTGTEVKPAQENKPVGKISPPYRRYTVNFFVNAGDTSCAANQGGGRTCTLESEIFVYDADGNVLDTQSDGRSLNVPGDHIAELMRTGIRFSEQISVPVESGAFLRIGVRDAATNKVGAIELPVSAVSNVPPLLAAAQK